MRCCGILKVIDLVMIKEGPRVTVKDTKLENVVSTSGVKFLFALMNCEVSSIHSLLAVV